MVDPLDTGYMSHNMKELKYIIDTEDHDKFSQALEKEIYDTEDVLMFIYSSVVTFNDEHVFNTLIKRNNYFEVNPDLHVLLSQPKIFYQFQRF